MDTIAILNRRTTVLHLPPRVIVGKDADGDRVSLEPSTPLMPAGKDKPVATSVPLEVWERAKQHRSVKQWLALGWVGEKPADVQAPTETPPPDSLSGYAGPAALALVETEQNESTLRMWLAAEGRPPIKDAITKRLSTVAKPQQARAK